ncbi:hypothetical protein AYI70_g11593, partial [Smittium culicis]
MISAGLEPATVCV